MAELANPGISRERHDLARQYGARFGERRLVFIP